MSLQAPILIVSGHPGSALSQAFQKTGAYPVIEVSWAGAATAVIEVKPAAVVVASPDAPDAETVCVMSRLLSDSQPFLPMIARVRDDAPPALPDALTISDDAPVEQLIARISTAQRVRSLHATVLARAQALKEERNILADLPAGDPADDATVLLVGRGRHHATLSVAVGERMGVIGALSVDTAERCLNARDVDGILIGDGLPAGSLEAFLTMLAGNPQFRELPVALLGASFHSTSLPNFVRARDPHLLMQRALPLIRMRSFEAALKRLLVSIECKGMIDADTGLLNARAFGQALSLAIEDAGERGSTFSLARFCFEQPLDHRTATDAARLVSRLLRDSDCASRQDDGSILFMFGDTELREAHVAARRLASVLKHTMLRPDRERAGVIPSVTLATLKPGDTALTLLTRVAPLPVAAA